MFDKRYMAQDLRNRNDADEIVRVAQRLFDRDVYCVASYAFGDLQRCFIELDGGCYSEVWDHGKASEEEVKDLLHNYYSGWAEDPDFADDNWDLADSIEDEDWHTARSIIWAENDGEPEPYEMWIVSGWLAAELQEHGEMISDLGGLNWWGRQRTGQSVALDGIFYRVAATLLDRTR